MMTGLSIVLGTSLMLFVGSLVYAVIQDWISNRRFFQNLVTEQMAGAGHHFHRAARRPVRVLGSFL